jgi:hypothetical protein
MAWLPPRLPRRPSSASLLAMAYAVLVIYASLYPFGPWAWPPGLKAGDLIGLPWPKYWGGFDVEANLAGYLPLGLLVYAAVVRSGGSLLLALGLSAWRPCNTSCRAACPPWWTGGSIPPAPPPACCWACCCT